MAFTAQFDSGAPRFADYTPTSAVNAGDVIQNTNAVMIAHLDIPANTAGALAVAGGIYLMNCNTNCNTDAKVFYDSVTKQFTTNATNTFPLGFTTEKGTLNVISRVYHQPF